MSQPDDKYFTPMYLELREMAEKEWAEFCKLIGDDAFMAAIICKLKARGNSMQGIANRFNLTKKKVRVVVEGKCYCDYPYMKSSKPDILASVPKNGTTTSQTVPNKGTETG